MPLTRPRHLIDFHVHCFPDQVAPRALEALTGQYGVKAHFDATVGGLLALMDDAGVNVSVVMPVATKAAQVQSINDWAAANSSERVVCFGAMHPDFADQRAEVERMLSLGLKGVKLQPQWQEFDPDGQRIAPFLEAAEGRLIVLFHAGNEIVPITDVRATPQRLAAVHARYPRLTMVAAHMGGYLMFDESENHIIGRDGIHLDTSYLPPAELPDERMLRMIRAHGAERILFATDGPFGDPAADLERLLHIGLTQDELEAICWQNAATLLGLHSPQS